MRIPAEAGSNRGHFPSSFAFKGQQRDLREIGEILNVANVLEGSADSAYKVYYVKLWIDLDIEPRVPALRSTIERSPAQ